MTLLSFWLFVFCALFIVQTLKRAFPTSFSVAKRRRKVWAALVRAALVCGLAVGGRTFEVFCWSWEAVIKKEGVLNLVFFVGGLCFECVQLFCLI